MNSSKFTDYPAAHSMDTTWFGVDEDGEIAVFETGATGIIPTSITTLPDQPISEEWYDVYHSLPENSDGLIEIPLSDKPLERFCRPEDLDKNLKELLKEGFREEVLIRYRDTSNLPIAELYEDDLYTPPLRLSGNLNIVLHPYEPDTQIIKQLVEAGKIIAIAPQTADKNLIQLKADALYITNQQAEKLLLKQYATYLSKKDLHKKARDWLKEYMGLHIYIYDEDTGFYEADVRPLNPVNIAHFSNRETLEKSLFRFNNFQFSNTSMIQPFAFSDCETFGAPKVWMGLDGSYHRDSSYQNAGLLNETGTTLSKEQLLKIGTYKTGRIPPEYDMDAWFKWAYPEEYNKRTKKQNSILRWFGFGKQ